MSTLQVIILIALFGTSCGYAWVLNWAKREWPELYDDFTIATVVVGVGYTIGAIALLLGWQIAAQVLGIFIVSATPIAARSVINAVNRQRNLNRKLNGDLDDQNQPELY